MSDDENAERQNTEISLLQAAYPAEFTWRRDRPAEVLCPGKLAN
jgi:hypothetical protein